MRLNLLTKYFTTYKINGLVMRLTLIGLLLASATVFPEVTKLGIAVRIMGLLVLSGLILFIRLPQIVSAESTYPKLAKQKEIVTALRAVAARRQIWTVHWRIILFRLGHPGHDKLLAAAIFSREDALPHFQGWVKILWPSAPWMFGYVRWTIEEHMEKHGWPLKDNPHYIYRHWHHKTDERHIAEEILGICTQMNISIEEITLEKIGESPDKGLG